MVKITYICDCCKCNVQKEKFCSKVCVATNCDENKPWSIHNFQHIDRTGTMDLCASCYKKFLDYIDTFLVREE